jgi:hypothetical protein
MHLAAEFGHTVDAIEQDGFAIAEARRDARRRRLAGRDRALDRASASSA